MWQQLDGQDGDISQLMMEYGSRGSKHAQFIINSVLIFAPVSPVEIPRHLSHTSANTDSPSFSASTNNLGKRKPSLVEAGSSKKHAKYTIDDKLTFSEQEEDPVIIVSRDDHYHLYILIVLVGTLCSVNRPPLQKGTALLRDLGNRAIYQPWWRAAGKLHTGGARLIPWFQCSII